MQNVCMKYDINKVEMEYITREKPTLISLSKEFGVPFNTLRVHCTKRNWKQKRSEHWKKVMAMAEAEHAQTTAERIAALKLESIEVVAGFLKNLRKIADHEINNYDKKETDQDKKHALIAVSECGKVYVSGSQAIQNLEHNPAALNDLVKMVMGGKDD